MSYNKFIGCGHVTRSPELRYLPNGTPIANTGMAFNRKWKQGDEQKEEVCFLDLTVWAKQAEVFCQYVVKGQELIVEGYLKQEHWDDKGTGQKRSKHVLSVEQFRFVGKKDDHSQGGNPD